MSACFQTAAAEISGAGHFLHSLALHGGMSQQFLVGDEKQSDFDALLRQLLEDHQPDTMQARLFVEDVAVARWFLWRRQRAHSAIESALYASTPDPADWSPEQIRKLTFAERYRIQAERGLKRALTLLESWEKSRRRDHERAHRKAQWEANYALRERRVAMQEQKLELARTRDAAREIRFAKNAVSSPSKRNAASPEPAVRTGDADCPSAGTHDIVKI